MPLPDRLILPRWYDLHVHVRQGAPMKEYIGAQIAMGCAGILAMPNTKPPVGKVFSADSLPYWSIEEYLEMIRTAGGDRLEDIIVPLYLTADTTPKMIEDGAKAGILRACKYYPPHGTTNADHGRPLEALMKSGVIDAISDNNVVLCLHGEEQGLSGEDYFGRNSSAEDFFYRERMPRLREAFPNLRISCEHITTRTAVEFVEKSGDKTGATITPQHLLYTAGHLLQGMRYHLYCLPLVKFEDDRQALLAAVLNKNNRRFYAGTDSAPHTTKCTPCGCAAGCFTGGIAPQLYAEAFDQNGGHDELEQFLCHNGPAFYGLAIPTETFTLVRGPTSLETVSTPEGDVLSLPQGLGRDTLGWGLEA
jgi:dihydroorotase